MRNDSFTQKLQHVGPFNMFVKVSVTQITYINWI
jgi:hypothetical protein